MKRIKFSLLFMIFCYNLLFLNLTICTVFIKLLYVIGPVRKITTWCSIDLVQSTWCISSWCIDLVHINLVQYQLGARRLGAISTWCISSWCKETYFLHEFEIFFRKCFTFFITKFYLINEVHL